MPIGSLSMRASNITLVIVGIVIIFFGFFLSRRVNALANTIAYQDAKNKAILTGYASVSTPVKNLQHK